ncbi:MAG: DNA gyrase inhibitor YacG [Planctomycetota bacterium]
MEHKCPVCQKPVNVSPQRQSQEATFFPFCSRRCKLVDLGIWLDAEYKIWQSQEAGEPSNTGQDGP